MPLFSLSPVAGGFGWIVKSVKYVGFAVKSVFDE